MFETFLGLPVHVLVNHAVLVLVPFAAVAAVAVALVPRWRARFGPMVAVITVAAVASVPVAVSSGMWLRDALGYPEDGFRHGDVAEPTLWWTLPLLVLTVALVLLDRRGARGRGSSPLVLRVVAGLVVVAAVAATYQVVRVGHLGTESVWEGRVPTATTGG